MKYSLWLIDDEFGCHYCTPHTDDDRPRHFREITQVNYHFAPRFRFSCRWRCTPIYHAYFFTGAISRRVRAFIPLMISALMRMAFAAILLSTADEFRLALPLMTGQPNANDAARTALPLSGMVTPPRRFASRDYAGIITAMFSPTFRAMSLLHTDTTRLRRPAGISFLIFIGERLLRRDAAFNFICLLHLRCMSTRALCRRLFNTVTRLICVILRSFAFLCRESSSTTAAAQPPTIISTARRRYFTSSFAASSPPPPKVSQPFIDYEMRYKLPDEH